MPGFSSAFLILRRAKTFPQVRGENNKRSRVVALVFPFFCVLNFWQFAPPKLLIIYSLVPPRRLNFAYTLCMAA